MSKPYQKKSKQNDQSENNLKGDLTSREVEQIKELSIVLLKEEDLLKDLTPLTAHADLLFK
ncbi:hypothetical protein [Cellvibrio sp. BR]|uniref:hypothetical protein n=1 Tax=Cellvibrio sp. BR TaxID=1134474 RepID=UPI00058B9D2B|nr:hypothetical protein [Cellvibrio sp. BR]